jgi:hypothetical protein
MDSPNLTSSLPVDDARSASRALVWSLAIAACVVVDIALLYGLMSLSSSLLEIPELRWRAPAAIGALLAIVVIASNARRVWRDTCLVSG